MAPEVARQPNAQGLPTELVVVGYTHPLSRVEGGTSYTHAVI